MTPPRVIARILRKTAVTPGGCWQWQGSTIKGYGQIVWHEDGEPHKALTHRAIYEAVFGELPEGAQVDHLCHDPRECQPVKADECEHRACCNPFHLAEASARQNVLRSGSFAAKNAVKTTCPNGHPYDAANTYVTPAGGRQCRACRTAHVRATKRRRQTAA